MLTMHDVVQVAEAQKRFPNWILWLLAGVVAVWAIGSMTNAFPWPWEGSRNVPAVQPEQQVQIGPAPVDNPPAQNVEPEVVAPISGPTHVNWVKIGEASNGEQVLALPIPWDMLVRDRVQADPRILVWLDQVNRPIEDTGPGELIGYLLAKDRFIMYGLADPAKPGVSYWKAEIPLSEIKGLSP